MCDGVERQVVFSSEIEVFKSKRPGFEIDIQERWKRRRYPYRTLVLPAALACTYARYVISTPATFC
jgi:hypothetical protein